MKTRIILSTIVLMATSAFANVSQDTIKKVEQLPMFKSVNAQILQMEELGDLYQIRGLANKGQRAGFDGFVTKDLKVIILGKAFDAQQGKEILLDLDTSMLKEVAAFKRGNGKKEFFLFTDPECPYCINIEKELENLADDVTLYTILFPLEFHQNARSMSYYVLSQKNNDAKVKAFKSVTSGGQEYKKTPHTAEETERYDSFIDKGIKAAEEFSVSGTPTVMNAKGHRVGHDQLVKK